MLKGYRTKLSGFFASLPTAFVTLGSQVDPAVVQQVLSDYPIPLAAYQVVTYLATHYFYDNKQEAPNEEEIIELTSRDFTDRS